MPTIARYDEQAAWYEEFAGPNAESHRDAILRLLGPGSGWCLDLGCGTGHYSDILRDSGRDVIGVDLSGEQLRYGRLSEVRLAPGIAVVGRERHSQPGRNATRSSGGAVCGIIDAGLQILDVQEPRAEEIPYTLAILARS